MPDRRRVAVVGTPLLALLAALLVGWSVAAAQAPDPLTLTLTAERSECTAGTLNPVSWTISGGTAPYTLTVAGESVDPTAESVNVTCGALPERASSAPGTITATVTDATGAPATARAAYTIVPPLPAPTGLDYHALRTHMQVWWDDVLVAATAPSAMPDCPCPLYLLRWRVAGTEDWAVVLHPVTSYSRPGDGYELLVDLSEGTTYELAVAALRDAVEQETPSALNWGPTVTATTVAPATGVRATATHDTITVTWDPQPAAKLLRVTVWGPDGAASQQFRDGSTAHEAVFSHLPPDTEYTVEVVVAAALESPHTEITVSTTAAPADWTPLPRGPQNLRTSVTHNSVTVDWDAPHAGANDQYHVFLFHTGADREPTAADRREHKLLYGAGVTQHTFMGLVPTTTYRVAVRHPDIVSGRVEVAATTAARAGPPLRLTLAAERAECTAGTLNPVTWEIRGGAAPYRLTVDGESVDPDAESATVTCGALPEGASEASGTITASVTDATGAPATASATYTIVPPLPAPETGKVTGVVPDAVFVDWYTAEPPPGADALVRFLVRSREVGSTAWTYRSVARTSNPGPRYRVQTAIYASRHGVAYEGAVAAMRHPLEAETPEALHWTPSLQATTTTYPANVTVTSTHDTVTVRWDRQPSATYWSASLRNADTYTSTRISARDAESWGDPASATHEVTFRHMAPDTEYLLRVGSGVTDEVSVGRHVRVSVRTKPAPAGSTPLPRGPQNLRATSTATTITVTWDPPFAEAKKNYRVYLYAPGGGEIYPSGFKLDQAGVYEPPWTFTFGVPSAGQVPLTPGAPYRIRLVHDGIVDAEAEILIATQPAEASGSGRATRGTNPGLTCVEYLVGAVICT